MRAEYTSKSLMETDIEKDPIAQFSKWFDEATAAKVIEPNAMSLGTVDTENRPSVRIVLLKEIVNGQFLFFTNYQSDKGIHMAKNPFVSLTFFWAELERQVRISGKATKITDADSIKYFNKRPRGSQIGAWSSPQSSIIEGRGVLEEHERRYSEMFKDQDVPKPDHWGGYGVLPDSIEFWQGRRSRLHDRILYKKEANGWKLVRLAP